MLRLEGVSVAYGKHEALHEVSLSVPAGETTAILGTNGAGKTTMLNAIVGLVRPRPGGRFLFEGRRSRASPPTGSSSRASRWSPRAAACSAR